MALRWGEVNIMKLLQKETAISHIIDILMEEMNDEEKESEETDDIGDNWDGIEMGNPHIVTFYNFWFSHHKSHLHQIFEYYEHGTLADIFENKGSARFNFLQILETLEQLCDGLQFIHSKNLIHMDLKPQNIMISSEHIFKIGDFGVSIDCNVNPNETPSSAKKPRLHCSGDPGYIAPEVLSFDRSLENGIDAKVDIFALGIILLELLCDITAPSQGQIFQDLRNDKIDFNVLEPSPLHGKKEFGFHEQKRDRKVIDAVDYEVMQQIGDDIKDLCRRMLRKDSKLRPNCAQIMSEIDLILDNEEYDEYFAQSDNLKQLVLPSEDLSEIPKANDNKDEKRRDGHLFCVESPKSYDTLHRGFRSQSPASDSKNHNNHNKPSPNSRSPSPSPGRVRKNLSEALTRSRSPSPAKGVRRNLSEALTCSRSPSPARGDRVRKNLILSEALMCSPSPSPGKGVQKNLHSSLMCTPSPAKSKGGVRRNLSAAFALPSPMMERTKGKEEKGNKGGDGGKKNKAEEPDGYERKEREEDDEFDNDIDIITSRTAFDFSYC